MISELGIDTIAYDEGWRYAIKTRVTTENINWCKKMFMDASDDPVWEAWNSKWFLFKNQEDAQLFYLSWDTE